jgi:hypothetical protein
MPSKTKPRRARANAAGPRRSAPKRPAPSTKAKPVHRPAAKPAARSAAKRPAPSKAKAKAPAPAAARPESAPPRPDARRHVLSLSFLRDGDEFLARLETDAGQITELKNRSLDQLLTLVAGELEDLLE